MKRITIFMLLLLVSIKCFSQTTPQANYVEGGINVNVPTSWSTVVVYVGYSYTIAGNQINISICYDVTPLLLETELNNDLFIETSDTIEYTINLIAYSKETGICDTFLFETSIPLSVGDFTEIPDNITVFPNPSSGFIQIEAGNHKIIAVKIYNFRGQLLQTSPNLERNISDLESGIYIMALETESGMISKKIVLQK